MGLNEQVHDSLKQRLAAPAGPESRAVLNGALRLLAKWRSVLIRNTLLREHGTVVQQGPLKGMDFLADSEEGCDIAKLLGTYEQPLQRHIEAVLRLPYRCILNIGCAEGYYAVGMARRLEKTKVLAFDTNPKAREACRRLAQKNGVSDKVEIHETFTIRDFEKYGSADDTDNNRKALVFCDIEGAEIELLDPDAAPALRGMDLIVEAHECLRPGVVALLESRFAATHEIELVEDNGQRQLEQTAEWFGILAHLDQLLAVWEWRSGPTPWLVMKSRNMSATDSAK